MITLTGAFTRRVLAAALWLVIAGPAGAQEDSELASRLILQMQQMREELRELRGMVEAQAQEIERLSRRQRDQYLDLDQRLSALSSGVTPAGTANTQPDHEAPAQADAPTGAPPAAALGEPGAASPELRPAIDPVPQVDALPDPGSMQVRELTTPTEAEKQAYEAAFQAMRETRYADAAEGFDRFLREYPTSSYAPNALYWLGEVYYVNRDFQTALSHFRQLLERYPGSSKQADALLKIGFSHYELGQWERARAALEQVVADWPGTNHARLAENRLRAMRLEGHL